MAHAKAQDDIDESLQSRQMAVYGRTSMRRLRNVHILLVGGDGVAAEVAKNVILANVRAVTLCDLGAKVTKRHLSSHFYLRESDIGKSVARASYRRLQELNDAVCVSVLDDIPESFRDTDFTTVVCIGTPRDVALRLNDACRAQTPPMQFIRCAGRGLYGKFRFLHTRFRVL